MNDKSGTISIPNREYRKQLDYFAGCALSGIVAGVLSLSSSITPEEIEIHMNWDYACEKSYEVARLMMKRREAS